MLMMMMMMMTFITGRGEGQGKMMMMGRRIANSLHALHKSNLFSLYF